MPRYFFSASDADGDETGTELRDHAAARRFAIQFAGEIMNDHPDILWDGREFSIFVTDELRRLLFTIKMVAVNAPAGEGTE